MMLGKECKRIACINVDDILLVLIFWGNTIPMVNKHVGNVAICLATIVWLVRNAKRKIKYASKWDAILMIYISYCILSSYLSGNFFAIKLYTYGLFAICFPAVVFNIIKKRTSQLRKVYVYIWASIALLVSSFMFVSGLYPDRGEAAYYVAYNLVFVGVFALFMGLKAVGLHKVKWWLCLLAVVYSIIKCHFMIAIVSLIIGSVVLLLFWSIPVIQK